MASVKQGWIKMYGQQKALKMWQEQKKKYGRTKEQLLEKYGKQYVQQLSKKKATFTMNHYIDKYGQQKGKEIWEQVKRKKVKTCQDKIDRGEFNVKRLATKSLKHFQQKYGIKEGYKRYKNWCIRIRYMNSKSRYLNQFGDDGQNICKKIKDTVSLESFCKRQGQQLGRESYRQHKEKMSKILKQVHIDKPQLRRLLVPNKENFVRKYGLQLGEFKYNDYIVKRGEHLFSKSSQQLFWLLYGNLSQELKRHVRFGELNGQQAIYANYQSNYPNKVIYLDFYCGYVNIEFDGQYWHRDTKLQDQQRDTYLQSKGFKILRIKQKDWKNKLLRDQIINNCKEFINENAQIC